MAHLIDMTGGRANMAYVGETPWHGLGSSLSQGASIDQWRVEAGLNWNAGRATVKFDVSDSATNPDTMPRIYTGESDVLYRDDTFQQLGIVSARYQIVQPGEVLEFFRDIVGKGGLELETAGSLDNGRKVWAMAKTGDGMSIKGQDRVEGYLLLSTSFDGSMATKAQFTSVRVVCNNTLSIATASSKGAVVVPHSSTFDATGAKVELGLIHGAWSKFEDEANALADRRLTNKEAMQLLFDIMEPKAALDLKRGDAVEVSTKRKNQITSVFDLFQGRGMGAGFVSSAGTAWGMVNAITQYIDHDAGHNVNNRFRSGQFGPGAAMKQEAFKQALLLVA